MRIDKGSNAFWSAIFLSIFAGAGLVFLIAIPIAIHYRSAAFNEMQSRCLAYNGTLLTHTTAIASAEDFSYVCVRSDVIIFTMN